MQEAFFGRIDGGEIEAVTSELAILECLVRPLRDRNERLARVYMEFLAPRPGFMVRPITRDVLISAAGERANNGTKLADAIHVATAMEAAADVFLSNDRRLRPSSKMLVQLWDAIQ